MPIAVAMAAMVMVLVSLFTKAKEPSQLDGLIWNRKDTLTFGTHLMRRLDQEGNDHPARSTQIGFWKDHRLLALISLLLMSAIIWWLR